jgi:arsenate reductase
MAQYSIQRTYCAMTLSIYHNPRCSKSRQTLEILTTSGHQPHIIEYLTTPPDAAALEDIITALGTEPVAIMRTNEEEYKAARNEIDAMNRADQLEWLAANIRVLQRPIVINGNQARIGRPPESVLEILD